MYLCEYMVKKNDDDITSVSINRSMPLSRWKPLEAVGAPQAFPSAVSSAEGAPEAAVVPTCAWRVPMQGWRPPVLVASAGRQCWSSAAWTPIY